MAQVEQKYVQRLRDSGLLVSEPFPAEHGWAHGVRVGKPANIEGNFIPDYEAQFGDIAINAPTIILYSDGKLWAVLAQDHCPSPGPGDFESRWSNPSEAVDDILDFYFGNTERMAKMAAAIEQIAQRDINTIEDEAAR